MRITLKLTLDGLVRALRAEAHRRAAETMASRAPSRRAAPGRALPVRGSRPDAGTTRRDDTP